MHIRPATSADIVEMHRVRMSVVENALSDPASVQPPDYERILQQQASWVAEIDGVVGFAMADLPRANIWALFVDPAFEGRRIGRTLHDTMMAAVFAAGVDRAWLTTTPGTRAERFYTAAGWRRVSGGDPEEIRFELSSADTTFGASARRF